MKDNIPNFAFDIDDVCFHSFNVIADTIKDWYGLVVDEPTSFNIPEVCNGIPTDDVYKVIDYSLINFFEKMEPVHGSIAFLRKYQNITKRKIIFITSRNSSRVPEIESATFKLLSKWISDLDYEVHFPKAHGKTKGVACNELGIKIFIDDRVKYCVDVSNSGCLALMMTRKWNKKFNDPENSHNIIRVGNWYDVNLIFEAFLKM